jgi:hypothetical protein
VVQTALWATTDAEARKRGERTGLETPVVHAVNDVDSMFTWRKPGGCQSKRDKSTAWGVRSQG